MTAIILLVRSRAGKLDPLAKTISVEVVIDKLAAVVRIQSQEREGQPATDAVYSRPDSMLALAPYSHTLRPPTGYVYCAQGGQIEALGTLAAMGYQIYLDESGPILFPVGEGSDRYRTLEKASRSCGRSRLPPSEHSIGP
jgi:hypothetical protein